MVGVVYLCRVCMVGVHAECTYDETPNMTRFKSVHVM